MPQKTRQMLIALAKMFKESKPLDANGTKGAALDSAAPARVATETGGSPDPVLGIRLMATKLSAMAEMAS